MANKAISKWPVIIGAGFVVAFAIGVMAQRRSATTCPIMCLFKGENKDQMAEETIDKNQQLKNKLTPLQYRVTQRKGTEAPFTGKYYDFHGKGKYVCIVCDSELFGSETKFDSGTGWPSFWAPISKDDINEQTDNSFLMSRTEVTCGKCGAHLGHVFKDGPKPTGLRYCINSASLNFVEQDANEKQADPNQTGSGK